MPSPEASTPSMAAYLLRGTAREQLGGLSAPSEAEEVQVQTVDTLIGTRPESKGSYKMSM